MLKNKWDVLRKDWGIWLKLVRNETGLGWDPVNGTVIADSEWWTRKIQVTPDASKFRTRGPLLVHEQETLFSDCVANGASAWTPNSGVMPEHMADDMSNGEPGFPHELVNEEYDPEFDAAHQNLPPNMFDDDFVPENPIETPVSAPVSAAPSDGAPRCSKAFPPCSRIAKGKKTTTTQIVAKCLSNHGFKV